jgi:hypothetical protein
MFNGRRQPSRGGTSRMTRECQVRFRERLGVQFPGPTRQQKVGCYGGGSTVEALGYGGPGVTVLIKIIDHGRVIRDGSRNNICRTCELRHTRGAVLCDRQGSEATRPAAGRFGDATI